VSVTPIQHLLAWLTPARRQLIVGKWLDRYAKRSVGSFARFLDSENNTDFSRVDLTPYYSVLQVLGYLPPGDVWVPRRALTAVETSSDVREWFTPERRKLIRFRALDILAGRPLGVFGRYLGNEQHVTFKIIGIDVYYSALKLLGFEPLPQQMNNSHDFISASEHLLTWFTPERRGFINSAGLDVAARQPDGTLSQFLAGFPAGRQQLANGQLKNYYPGLARLGYSPDLDLSQDESVKEHQTTLTEKPT
jgi:hypothetical protein